MKKILSLAIMAMAFVGFTSCEKDEDETIVLEKTSWEGQVTETSGETETTISYRACFTGKNEGVELQHLVKKESGRTIIDYKIYSPFTYEFDGHGGAIHYGRATADNGGIVYHKSQLPDVNMAWYAGKKVLKTYTNMPCHQVAYAPIQVPELTVPDSEFPEAQAGNMKLALGRWTCKSPSVKLVLDPAGKSSYTVDGVVLAEGNMTMEDSAVRIDGKAIHVIVVTSNTMLIRDFAGNILSLTREI